MKIIKYVASNRVTNIYDLVYTFSVQDMFVSTIISGHITFQQEFNVEFLLRRQLKRILLYNLQL